MRPKRGNTQPKTPSLTSNFALLDIKKNRHKLAEIVAAGYRIPFAISGFIQAGKGGIGHDDGVSIEFAADVDATQFGDPVPELSV